MPCHCLSNSAQSWMLAGESARFPGVLHSFGAPRPVRSLPYPSTFFVACMYRARKYGEGATPKHLFKTNKVSQMGLALTRAARARLVLESPHKSIPRVPPLSPPLSTNFPAESNFNLESFHVRNAISATQTSNRTNKQSHNPNLSSEHVSNQF